ncbi:alpha/beta hydrolase [Aerococcaceae bacterium WGS1372]
MIDKFDYYFPYKDTDKHIHVYLPDGALESETLYPVMYMYDGHNLFFDEEATYGTSWGLKDFMESTQLPLIIVGIECSHEGDERLAEYCPYIVEESLFNDSKRLEGYGDFYMEWLVHDLKPYIDERYPTYSYREATAIGGSSMGGLMAFYSGLRYNDYFSKVAVLSPSFMLCQDQLQEEWEQSHIHSDTNFFFSYGEEEVNKFPRIMDSINYYHDEIAKAGGTSYVHIQEKGEHNEATWRAQNGLYMDVLWG